MKKAHSALLMIAVITALSSAYSLAAINQVHRVDFEWYSQYEGRFTSERREAFGYKNNLKKGLKDLVFAVATCREELEAFLSAAESGAGTGDNSEELEHAILDLDHTKLKVMDLTDFDRSILLCCSFGEVGSPAYRIKVTDVARRGGTVEVRVYINSPGRELVKTDNSYSHIPLDIVRIDKSFLKPGGKLNFIFKDQDGRQLAIRPVFIP